MSKDNKLSLALLGVAVSMILMVAGSWDWVVSNNYWFSPLILILSILGMRFSNQIVAFLKDEPNQ